MYYCFKMKLKSETRTGVSTVHCVVVVFSNLVYLFLEMFSFFTSIFFMNSECKKKTTKILHYFKLTVTTYAINEHHQCL